MAWKRTERYLSLRLYGFHRAGENMRGSARVSMGNRRPHVRTVDAETTQPRGRSHGGGDRESRRQTGRKHGGIFLPVRIQQVCGREGREAYMSIGRSAVVQMGLFVPWEDFVHTEPKDVLA